MNTTSILPRDNRPPDTARAVLLLFLVFGMIAVNALANILPFNGVTSGEVSARYPTVVTPATWAFNIWTVIYLGMIVLAIWQMTPRGLRNDNLRAIRGPLILNFVLNAGWLWLFHHFRFVESVVVIVLLLATLAIAYRRLDRRAPENSLERWNVRAPLSIYFGWVTVATIVNIMWALVGLGVIASSAVDPETWGALAVAVAGAIGTILSWRQGDMSLGLTFLWALAAIAAGQRGEPLVFGTALAATGLVATALVAARWRGAGRRPYQTRPTLPRPV